jgi:hypothetical protein
MMAVDVLTYHNDNLRDGLNASETTLTPANVNSASFGKIGQVSVDGAVFAQPLVNTGVMLPDGTTHDLVFVATEHDSVYAFDANTLAPVWQRSLIDPANGITTVASTDVGSNAVKPEIGITSTPVIDPSTNTIYVVGAFKSMTPSGPVYSHEIFAFDLATGQTKLGGPVTITANVRGTGDAAKNRIIALDSKMQLQRSALLLSGGVVYVSFASYDDQRPYHGWVIGYNAQTLRRVTVWNDTPNGRQGGIWMGGAGPSALPNGQIFLATSNGTYSKLRAGSNFGDSVMKLNPGRGGGLTVADYFTPHDQKQMDINDNGIGSGGVIILPDQPGPVRHLLMTSDKSGSLYLINRDNMGKFRPRTNRIVQELSGVAGNVFGIPAYFSGTLYVAGIGHSLVALTLVNGKVAGNAASSSSSETFAYPGATPSISSNGTGNGIVWAVSDNSNNAILRAYDASNVSHALYDSSQVPNGRDKAGPGVRFAVPTVANGKVYVGGGGTLTVYGLLPG